jgi:hypothetical protein
MIFNDQGGALMSLTVSRGFTDAGRWTAVATTVAEHLDAMRQAKRRHKEAPPPPKGAIEAARRFFRYVLEGIHSDQRISSRAGEVSLSEAGRPSPSMAGFSNLSIAVNVMHSAKGTGATNDLGALENQITSLLNALDRLQEKPSEALPHNDFNLLSTFLRELQRQGEIERDASVASHERPHSQTLQA